MPHHNLDFFNEIDNFMIINVIPQIETLNLDNILIILLTTCIHYLNKLIVSALN